MELVWKSGGVFNGEWSFYFLSADEKTRDAVLEAKFWHITNKPLILRKWQPGMHLLKLSLSKIPIWIKLVHLPMKYWTPICVSYVASGVGNPLYDSVTEEQLLLRYARVLVEVSAESEFPKEIELDMGKGNFITIGGEYPWIPIKCSTCNAFGHLVYACPRKEKKIWAPKVPIKKDDQQMSSILQKSVGAELKIFDKTVQRPIGGSSKLHNDGKTVDGKVWTNSFDVLKKIQDKEEMEGGICRQEGEGESSGEDTTNT